MKKATHIFSLVIAMTIISTTATVYAQERGHKKGHPNNLNKGRDKDRDHSTWRKHDSRDHYSSNHHTWDDGNEKEHRRDDHTGYHNSRDHYRHHPPVVVRHYAKPRYIYYRDYDVYFDFHRNVYITSSGKQWLVSTSVPRVLHRVDIARARRMEVNYDWDDFPGYLERQRPTYRRVYSGF